MSEFMRLHDYSKWNWIWKWKIGHIDTTCLYALSNTLATFEAQFMKKLINTEAGLKKSVAYKKAVK